MSGAALTPDARSAPSAAKGTLTMSVVICTRHRPESLLRCVQSVLGQTALPIEIIVVDDGDLSLDSRDTLAAACKGAGAAFIYLRKELPGLTASRNLAVTHARGDIVQFLDDDVELDGDFCRHILRLYERDPDGTLLGTDGTLIEPQPSVASGAFALVYRLAGWWALPPLDRRCRALPVPLRDRRWAVPTLRIAGATMAFRRSVLLRHKFDESLGGYALGEDRDMAWRVGGEGWILRSRAARAVHHHDPTGRPNPFAFGRMTVLNYVRAMRRAGRTRIGDSLAIGYSLLVIAAALMAFTLVRPRRYGPELLGMLSGGVGVIIAHLRSGRTGTPHRTTSPGGIVRPTHP